MLSLRCDAIGKTPPGASSKPYLFKNKQNIIHGIIFMCKIIRFAFESERNFSVHISCWEWMSSALQKYDTAHDKHGVWKPGRI